MLDGWPQSGPVLMTPDQFRASLKRLSLTQNAFAGFLGRGDRTVRRWASGDLDIPVEIALLLALMERYSLTTGKLEKMLEAVPSGS